MIHQLYHLVTDCTDPFHNLALEEQLLRRVEEGACILYLWQNQHTVVVGRNQNPWAECQTELLEAEGGRLVRRLSGGGAVYHDLGNLNFTFLVREADYSVPRQLEVILHALNALGIPAERSGRNDILADGRKCSGNAFYRSEGRCYHHGTLLVDVDRVAMSRYLTVDPAKLAAKGVASVRARVVNLKELQPELTIPLLIRQLLDSFQAVYGLPSSPFSGDEEALAERIAFFSSWDWRFGSAPPFTAQIQGRFDWGGLQLCFSVEQGAVVHTALYSDGLEADFLAGLPACFTGCRYEAPALTARLTAVPADGETQCRILADAAGLIGQLFHREETSHV